MNRRDLIKSLVALPIVCRTAYAGLCGSTDCTTPKNPLTLVFQGPFSIVLQTASSVSDNITGAVVFTPVEPQRQHLFKLNSKDYGNQASYNFNLTIPGFAPPSQPCIAKSLAGFCTAHTPYKSDALPLFVAVTLPCPNIVAAFDGLTPIPAMLGKTPVNMPRGYVLTYDTPPNSQPILNYPNHAVPPVGGEFVFEVGMDPKINPDDDCSHAARFYNESMLPFFPQLSSITIDPKQCPQDSHPRAMMKDPIVGVRSTTTLECKSGGTIVTSP